MIQPHTTVEYDSDRGITTVGFLIGYAFIAGADPASPDAYVIDIEPRFDKQGYMLPAGRAIVISEERVRPSLPLPPLSLAYIAQRELA